MVYLARYEPGLLIWAKRCSRHSGFATGDRSAAHKPKEGYLNEQQAFYPAWRHVDQRGAAPREERRRHVGPEHGLNTHARERKLPIGIVNGAFPAARKAQAFAALAAAFFIYQVDKDALCATQGASLSLNYETQRRCRGS